MQTKAELRFITMEPGELSVMTRGMTPMLELSAEVLDSLLELG